MSSTTTNALALAPMGPGKLKPRTAAELSKHAYASEVHRIEFAIFQLELISGQSRTIPLVAGMAMDDAILALYKAKGAFDTFSHDER